MVSTFEGEGLGSTWVQCLVCEVYQFQFLHQIGKNDTENVLSTYRVGVCDEFQQGAVR